MNPCASVADAMVGDRRGDSLEPLQLTQAAREGAMEAWLDILSQRHPDLIWVPNRGLDLKRQRS
jgi:hypothetical protein